MDKYEKIKVVGKGTFGKVYKARVTAVCLQATKGHPSTAASIV